MEIINRGTPPEEQKYRCICIECKSELLVKKGDAVAWRGLRRKLIFVCPVCKCRFNLEGVYL